MKLKLDIQDGVTILSVSEGVDLQQIAVLKAGLQKIFQSGRKAVLLDLTPLDVQQPPSAELHPEICGIPAWAQALEAQVVVASGIAGLGQAQKREEGVKMLISPLFKLLAHEAQLQAQLKTLETKRTGLQERYNNVAQTRDAVTREKKRNSELKRLVGELEARVRAQLRKRHGEAAQAGPLAPKVEGLQKTLTGVLEQEGVLPVT